MNKDAITERAKVAAKVKKDSELAEIIGISAPDFSNRKKRGTHETLIIEWAARSGYNVNWLLTGDGEMRPSQAFGNGQVKEDPGRYRFSTEHQHLIDIFEASHPEIQKCALRMLEESAKESRENVGGGSGCAGKKSA